MTQYNTATTSPNALQHKPNNRLGNRKTRSGCLTCKKRKVKCDEARPACQRCIKAERNCEGYEKLIVSYASPSQSSSTCPDVVDALSRYVPLSVPDVHASPSERRALHYFCIDVGPALGGPLDFSFWTQSILQLSRVEPAIYQAILALSSHHEALRQANGSSNQLIQKATEHYNKALSLTAQRVTDHDGERPALATCVAFICLEFMRRDLARAKQLYTTGANVLYSYLAKRRLVSTRHDDVIETFLPVYERLLVLGRFFGIVLPDFQPTSVVLDIHAEDRNTPWLDLETARNVLFRLISESHDLMYASSEYRIGEAVDLAIEERNRQRQQDQLSAYHIWLAKLELWQSQKACSITPEQERGRSMLLLAYSTVIVWISCAMARDESEFDRLEYLFRIIVEEAEKVVITPQGDTLDSKPVMFEMGVIPSLYLTIWKCRNPMLRRKGLELLHHTTEVEGLWQRDETIAMLKRIIEIEEQGLVDDQSNELVTNVRVSEVKQEPLDWSHFHVNFEAKIGNSSLIWKSWSEVVGLGTH